MALDFAEIQKVLEEASKASDNRKEIRKALSKVSNLVQALDIAVGEAERLLDEDAPVREKKPYTGKPRGRKKKVVEGAGEPDMFTAATPGTAAATPGTAASGKQADTATPATTDSDEGEEGEEEGEAKKPYVITVDGKYRMYTKKYTDKKTNKGVKVFTGDPENMKRKLMKEEGISEESFNVEYV